MHRRTFLHTLGAAFATPSIACAMSSSRAAGDRRLTRIGIQLYTLRDAARANLDRTLGDIAAAGYTDVELLSSMRNFEHSPREVRGMLDRHHLRAPSTHIGVETLANVDGAVEEARILGHEYLILADIPAAARRSLETFRAYADQLNRAGEAARKPTSGSRGTTRPMTSGASADSRATMRWSDDSIRASCACSSTPATRWSAAAIRWIS